MSRICKGDGECLEQTGDELDTFIKKLDIICIHNCIPIKCKNYILCKSQFAEMYMSCWGGEGLCRWCRECFGTWGKMPNGNIGKGILEVTDNIECPVCLEEKTCISQPYCNHSLCTVCFNTCYGRDYNREDEPYFPYPDLEEEYYADIENIKWENEYPLIEIWNDEWDKWDDDRIEKYQNTKHLFCICPVCHITKEIKYNQLIENETLLKTSFKILKKNWLMKKYEDNN
jgi:hypothetical protein